MIATSISLPVSLSVLLTGFQLPPAPPTAWGTWGELLPGQRDNRTAIEYSSLLTNLDVDPKSKRLTFDDNHPLVIVYCFTDYIVVATLKDVNGMTVYTQRFDIKAVKQTDPFYVIKPKAGGANSYQFTKEGEYDLQFKVYSRKQLRIQATPTTQVKFLVKFEERPDSPEQSAFVTGPWEHWAYLWFETGKEKDSKVEVRLWRRASLAMENEEDEYQAFIIVEKSRVLAWSAPQAVTSPQQTRLRFSMSHFGDNADGRFQAAHLLKKTGDYHVLVTKNGKLDAVYPFSVSVRKKPNRFPFLQNPMNQQVENGFQFHSNQPHVGQLKIPDLTSAIIPRMPSDKMTVQGAGDTIWMERRPLIDLTEEVKKDYQRLIPERKPPSIAKEQLERWRVPPISSPDRLFEWKSTGIELPEDAVLSVGDDLMAVGSNSSPGVKYLKAGETVLRTLDDEVPYSPEFFHVTGKKLVLVKDHQVFIHDISSGVTDQILPGQVFLADSENGPSLANVLSVDGYLVGTVNDKNRVAEKQIIKVIDISQSPPRIIPIKNANYEAMDVSSIAVDATRGQIAVSSRLKEQIYIANVISSAEQTQIDLSNAQGVTDRSIQLAGGYVIYVDTKNQLRQLDTESHAKRIITESGVLGAAKQGVAFGNGMMAVATNRKYGARYLYRIGNFPGQLDAAPETVLPIDGHPGYGMGSTVAIASDGTVFLAGSGDFGAGEYLQYFKDGDWKTIRNDQGRPLAATDVTTGHSMIAFKTPNKEGKPELAYALYGNPVVVPQDHQPQVLANDGNAKPKNLQAPQGAANQKPQVKVAKTNDSRTESTPETVSPVDSQPQGLESHIWLITFVLIAHLGIGAVFSLLILR